MNNVRAIIIDDEIEAREGLKIILSDDTDISVIDICSNGMDAITSISKNKPDLIFLDIQMPEINGFEVLNNIDKDIAPVVIFVTAYDQYAIKAFENHAIDYLVKPFSDERFYNAVNHAKEIINQKNKAKQKEQLSELLVDYLQSIKQEDSFKIISQSDKNQFEKLIIKSMGKIIFLNQANISHIEAYDYYINVFANGKKHLVRESLKSILLRLPNNTFFRISKSNIVNINHINSIEPTFSGNYSIQLQNGTKIKLSKNYKDLLSFI